METFTIERRGVEFKVRCKISGRFEKQTRHHPGATPHVDIRSFEVDRVRDEQAFEGDDPESAFDDRYAEEKIVEELERQKNLCHDPSDPRI